MKRTVPVGVSGKHLHVSQKDLNVLYGEGHQLTSMKELGQPGQFACEEVVDLVGPKGSFERVRILGPVRPVTQIEIAISDSFKLGVNPPVRESGDLADSPGLKLVGPKGAVELTEGVIIASRHIHMDEETAKQYNLKDKDIVTVKCEGPRAVLFDNVLVRVRHDFALELHVDTDEGNGAMLKNGQIVEII